MLVNGAEVERSADGPTAISLCVFCGARPGSTSSWVIAAQQVGELVGAHGHHMVYGGGGSGLMGVVARAAARSGGNITGVMPDFLYEREKHDEAPEQEIIVTNSLFERKRLMVDRADAFLALPGGYGTLDEVLEVISLGYLGVHAKPLVLLDVEGIWTHFLKLTEELHSNGFADRGQGSLFQVADTPHEALDLLERAVASSSAVQAAGPSTTSVGN